MRAGSIVILGFWLLSAVGCANCQRETVERTTPVPPPPGEARKVADATLLFDAWPGRWHASDLAFRSDWPSTEAYYTSGQVIWFRERFHDYQGPGIRQPDHTYRRFDTYRTGMGYR